MQPNGVTAALDAAATVKCSQRYGLCETAIQYSTVLLSWRGDWKCGSGKCGSK